MDVKRGQARMPGDYFDLILAFKCDFKGYEVPEGDKVIPRAPKYNSLERTH